MQLFLGEWCAGRTPRSVLSHEVGAAEPFETRRRSSSLCPTCLESKRSGTVEGHLRGVYQESLLPHERPPYQLTLPGSHTPHPLAACRLGCSPSEGAVPSENRISKTVFV